ncbi:MAG: hypothetical protein ACM3ZU_14180 [Bacteroidota bacterium]
MTLVTPFSDSPGRSNFGTSRARRATICAAFVSVLVFQVFCGTLHAQISISLTPLLIELTASPGETKTFDILLINESKAVSGHFRVFTADIEERRDGDYRVVEDGQSKYSCAKWIKLSKEEASLGPGEALSVTGKLTIPRGNNYGGRYAAVIFELAPEKRQGEEALASTEFVQRFVTVIEVSIPSPRVRKALSVSGFSVVAAADNPKYSAAFGKSALLLVGEVRNEGNTHVFARGFLTLRDGSGKRLRQIPLGSGRGLVLPETTVNLVSVLPAGLAPGNYIADIAVKYGGMRPALAKVPFTVGARDAGAKGVEGEARLAPFSVEPADMDITYPPGAVAARSVVVENESDVPIHVEGRALPLVYDQEGELVQDEAALRAAPADWSCAGWVELRPSSFDVAPKGKQVVRTVIAIPKDQAGGRYANIVFTATPASGAAGEAGSPGAASAAGAGTGGAAGQAGVAGTGSGRSSTAAVPAWTGEAGTVVFLTVGKKVEKQAELAELKVEHGGPSVGWVFSTTFKNTGTTHVKPQVAFAIKRHVVPESVPGIEYVGPGTWEEIDSIDLGELDNIVLPGGTRLLQAAYSRPLEPGDYMVEVTVKYGGKTPLYASKEFSVKQP